MQVNELVGRINGTHGTLEYSPIHYINQSVPQDELFAIYKMADACLVTSVRDGMNLVSHEYVLAQDQSGDEGASRPGGRQGPGVLVLSDLSFRCRHNTVCFPVLRFRAQFVLTRGTNRSRFLFFAAVKGLNERMREELCGKRRLRGNRCW